MAGGSALRGVVLAGLLLLSACGREAPGPPPGPFLMVLGVAQDGGYPQAACRRECCERARAAAANRRHVAALAVVDPAAGDRFLFDATPDLPEQLELLDRAAPVAGGHGIAGILLTHAHIGHYLGLAQLGREVMGTWDLPVYAMPRMRQFLRSSGPWDLLVRLRNIEIRDLSAGVELSLTPLVRVTPVLVPHRDEYSETVGFRISGPERTVLYVPDIDKWDRWDIPLRKVLAGVDVAYLDGTFFDAGEVQGRDASEIPHPLIRETIERLNALPPEERAKVHFIHMNHTNPALDPGSEARARILEGGFRVAEEGERVDL